jgi:transcriptional regulator with XRE-family HTH domain
MARLEAGLTQDQLADLASISDRPIYMFESGKGSIRLETYLKLLDVLGLELAVVPRLPGTKGL